MPKKWTVWLMAGLLLLLVPYALSAADLYNATVEVSPKTTGVAAQYTVGFNVSSTGALEGGRDEIILYFPEGTVIPATLSENLSADSILINGYSVEPRFVYTDANRLIITLPTAVDVRANGYVGVIIDRSAGIELPRKAGGHYLQVETSRDERVYTNSFKINGSQISRLEVSGSPATVDKFATYTISFRTSSQGGLSAQGDCIYLEFDQDIRLPRSVVSGDVQVNGEKPQPGGVTVDEQTNTIRIEIPSEVKIAGNDTVEVQIDSLAGIRNPRRMGTYQINVYTSRDSVSSSADYAVGMSISTPIVVLSSDAAGEKSQYSIGFTTSIRGALRPGKDYIYLYFPADTYIPNSLSAANVTVNGYQAKAVETSKNDHLITVRVPTEVEILNDTYVSVVIKSEAGVRNPNTADDYQIRVCTTEDKNQELSKKYAVTGTGVYQPLVHQSTYRPGEAVSLQMLFKGEPLGNLESGDKLTILFPTAYTLPSRIAERYVTVNGEEAATVEYVGQALIITVPDGTDNEEQTEIRIGSAAGVKNPARAGQYSLIIYSSKDAGNMINHTVTIGETAANGVGAKPEVELSDPQAGEVSSYTVTFINQSDYTLTEGSIITLSFPAGTVIPSDLARSFVRLNSDPPGRVEVEGNKILVYLPDGMEIKDDEEITVIISSSGNIQNPVAAGKYTLQAETSQGYFAESQEYILEGDSGENKEGKIVFKIGSTIAYQGDTTIVLDSPPTIIENFTVVPLRALGNALGAETAYEATTKTVTVKYNGKELVFYIDSKLVKVEDEWVTADIPATLINNRVMIPARFVSQSFGAAVSWNEETREVTISK